MPPNEVRFLLIFQTAAFYDVASGHHIYSKNINIATPPPLVLVG